MELSEVFGFFVILKESIKLLPKNGKLMALIVTLSLVIYSISFFLLGFSLKSLILHILVIFNDSFMPDRTSLDPNQNPLTDQSPLTKLTGQVDHLRQDVALLFAVEMAFMISFFIFSTFSTTATVFVSAMSYKDKTLSIKDLCLRVLRTWKRVLLTGFYTRLLGLGYFLFVLSLIAPLLVSTNQATNLLAILLMIFASIYYLHLAVVWSLAVVVSVVEECCYGMEALGKAATIVKGKRLHGIMINMCYNMFVIVLYLIYRRIIQGNKGRMDSKIIYENFPLLIFSSLAKMLMDVTYTVLYFQCKESRGEEIELYGSSEYTKLPVTQPIEK